MEIEDVRRLVKRTEPLQRVEEAVDLGRLADRLIEESVRDARHAGATWTELGARLGVTRQAVKQRFDPEGVTSAQPDDPEHPGKGHATTAALATQTISMKCRSCLRTLPGK